MDLQKILEQLSKLIDSDKNIIITNISTLNDGDDFLDTKSPIVLSIVNIEEDKIQKNQSTYIKSTLDDTKISRYNQPSQNLILSLLFSSYNKDLSKYLNGIGKLESIINYFQQHKTFYYKNNDNELINYHTFLTKTDIEKAKYHKVTMEFVSLSMEQLNQMWSYLGSKYMPSVLYKMRFYMVQSDDVVEDKLIKKVKIDLWENDKDNPIGLIETHEFDN